MIRVLSEGLGAAAARPSRARHRAATARQQRRTVSVSKVTYQFKVTVGKRRPVRVIPGQR